MSRKDSKKRRKRRHLYVCIVKGKEGDFFKWNTSNLLKFTAFLDRSYEGWRYFNVFDKNTRLQIGNFTKNHRPYYEKIS